MILKFIQKNRIVSAILAGAFGALAFAPIYFALALPISLSVFYLLLEKTSEKKKEIFWLGFAFGFGHFLAGTYWIAISLLVDAASFAWLIPFAITLIPSALAAYLALFAVSYKIIIKKSELNFVSQKIMVFALLWVGFEILRSTLFTGFPWNLAGYAWMFNIYTSQSAGVFGIYGLSLLAILISLLPILFIGSRVFFDKVFAAILATAFAANLLYGYSHIDDSQIIDSSKKLRLVQANIKQEMKWDASEKYENLLKHIEMTKEKGFEDVSVVIWSETSVPYVIEEGSDLVSKLTEAVPTNGLLVTGALRLNYADKEKTIMTDVWNSVFAIDKGGIVGSYDKRHLVPFGEYIPLQKYLPFITKITEGAVGFSEGSGSKTMLVNGLSFNPLVCYEGIFTNEILNRDSRPDLLINLTNDAWFGNSSGPYQHFDMVRMRAIEYGIPIARAANTGITAFVDPFGRVIKEINLNQSKTVDVNLVESLAPTIYEKYMYIPLMLFAALLLILIFLSKITNDARKDNSD
jgi:apolipoprotein N-acyltransferase